MACSRIEKQIRDTARENGKRYSKWRIWEFRQRAPRGCSEVYSNKKKRTKYRVPWEMLAVREKRAHLKTASKSYRKNPTNTIARKLKTAQYQLAGIYIKEQTEHIQNQIDKIRDSVEDRQSRIAWQTIKEVRRRKCTAKAKLKAANQQERIKLWKQHFENLLVANTPNQAETLLHSLERAAAAIGLHVNAHKTEYMCYNQTGDIYKLDGTSLKLADKFTYLGSSVSSTEKDIDTRLTKAWTAIDSLSIIWKSDLTDKTKRSFFQAAVVSILLYGCTTWTLIKRLEEKLDGNYTRMLRVILNKSWRQQYPTRHQLYGHLPPITKTIQVRRTRHAGHCWRSRDELISDVLLWTPTYGRAKARRPARTYIQQLCEDTGCSPEDLPEAINDREKWRERVRDICAGGTTWWCWWKSSLWLVMRFERLSFSDVRLKMNGIMKVFLLEFKTFALMQLKFNWWHGLGVNIRTLCFSAFKVRF